MGSDLEVEQANNNLSPSRALTFNNEALLKLNQSQQANFELWIDSIYIKTIIFLLLNRNESQKPEAPPWRHAQDFNNLGLGELETKLHLPLGRGIRAQA